MTAAVCALHCLVLPVLVASSPLLLLQGLLTPWVEWMLVVLSLGIGGISFRDTLRPGRSRRPLGLFLAGLTVLLLVRALVPEDAVWLERAGLLPGVALIMAAHIRHARDARPACPTGRPHGAAS